MTLKMDEVDAQIRAMDMELVPEDYSEDPPNAGEQIEIKNRLFRFFIFIRRNKADL